jgi:hypothetical protein
VTRRFKDLSGREILAIPGEYYVQALLHRYETSERRSLEDFLPESGDAHDSERLLMAEPKLEATGVTT